MATSVPTPSDDSPSCLEKNEENENDLSCADPKEEKAVLPRSSTDLENLPTLTTLRDVEEVNSASDVTLAPAIKWKRRIQFATLCWCFVLEGWNDGSTGPLLPRIQDTYHVGGHSFDKPTLCSFLPQVNFAIVSLLFVFLCVVRFHLCIATSPCSAERLNIS